MGGIYGDMLIAFPEQLRMFTVFAMIPKINGGWEVVEKSKHSIQGVLQHTGGKAIKESGGNLATSSVYELWTSAENILGLFTRIKSNIYRIKAVSEWSHEGGFFKYTLEKVIGDDGVKSKNTAWNTGSDSFG